MWIAEKVKAMNIRPLLLLTYGGTVLFVFVIVMIITVTSVYTLRDQVLERSSEALKNQITGNAGKVLAESAEVFVERLHFGLQAFALPAAYAVHDAVSRGTYSLQVASSNTDSSASVYPAPARLVAPLTVDTRFPCDPADPAPHQFLRGCEAFNNDYPNKKGKKISTKQSSVYLNGLRFDATNAQQKLTANAAVVAQTAVIDDHVRKAFADNPVWMGSWVAMSAGGLYRSYPGFVGDLSSANGVRTYNPLQRFWFTKHSTKVGGKKTIIARTNLDSYEVEYTEPYRSLDGNGFLLSMSVPIHSSNQAFVGVAGTDIQVAALDDITGLITFRKSGVAHLYHTKTLAVAASPQWKPAAGAIDIKLASTITLPTGGGATLGNSPTCESEERDGCVIMKRKALGGQYCLAAVVPLDEILEPIESQRAEINSTANELFVVCLVVILACFFGLVAPCSCVIALQLSQPIIRTSKDTKIIAGNIGGDLLKGVDADKMASAGGVGEVLYLRQGFLRMLNSLIAKRTAVKPLPKNPAFGQLLDMQQDSNGQAVHMLANVNVRPADGGYMGRTSTIAMPKEPSAFNRIRTRLYLQLILPMVVAMIIIISYSSTIMYQKSAEWVAPVKEMMIQEELQNLKVRAYERAALVTEVLRSYDATLSRVVDFTERLYNGELSHVNDYAAYFSPQRFCPPGVPASNCLPQTERMNSRIKDKWGEPMVSANFDSTFWYAPPSPLSGAMASKKLPDNQVYKTGSTMVQEHTGMATSLDNVARAAYFASMTTQISWAFENNEVYRGYPYMKQFDNPSTRFYCNDGVWGDRGTQITYYTPLCRDWYTKPRAANGQTVYGTVATDITTGMPFMSLGKGFYHSNGKFIGVVDVTINLGELEKILKTTPLYENGMVYMFDKNGCAILHPYLDSNKRREAECVQQAKLSAAGDQNFERAFRDGVVAPAKLRANGTWSDDWYNEDLGASETWYYVFMPVPNTPYQLVLTTVDRDIWKTATDLESELTMLTTTHMLGSLAFFLVFAAMLICLSIKMNRGFAVPVAHLGQMIAVAEKEGYKKDVANEQEVWSSELRALKLNFKNMLVALRFGNPAYHGGNKLKELSNLRNTRALLDANGGNPRGIGVCLSNLGNCVRGMDNSTREKAQLTPEERNPVTILQEATQNARTLAQDDENPDITDDTVGQRLLGLSLAQLDAGQSAQCVDSVMEAVNIHRASGKWQSLAKIAQIYVQSKPSMSCVRSLKETAKAVDEPSAELVSAVKSAASAALSLLTREEGVESTVDSGDASSLANLCSAQYAFTGDVSFLIWALNNAPNLDEATVCKLSKFLAEAQGDVGMVKIESILAPTYPDWKNASGGGPKAVQFVLDASGSMAGGYLDTCKRSISMIAKDYVADDDLVGFLAFAHYTKEIFPLMPKRGNDERIQDAIRGVATFGGTAFYDAIVEGIGKLTAGAPGMPKWLVALTDGADGHSKTDRYPPGRIGAQMLETAGVNIAVITVGHLPKETIDVVSKYVDSCTASGCNGMHVEAYDTTKIAEAFESIASMMDEGLAEHL